jgi:anti-sigma regulatory factor (Ser/Thr protein kinase)
MSRSVPSHPGADARRWGVRGVLETVIDRPAQMSAFRRRLRDLLSERGIGPRDREAFVLATAEALNNALEACTVSACHIEVAVSVIADHVCIEVRDATEGFKGVCVDVIEGADADDEHGRGLYLMRELVDSLELVPRKQGMLVRMIKRLEDEGPTEEQAAAC